MVAAGEINQNTAKTVLGEMFESGEERRSDRGRARAAPDLGQRGDRRAGAAGAGGQPEGAVQAYLAGKETLAKWLFGQVMRAASGQANPQVMQGELERQLSELREG